MATRALHTRLLWRGEATSNEGITAAAHHFRCIKTADPILSHFCLCWLWKWLHYSYPTIAPTDNNVTGPRFVVHGRLSSSHRFKCGRLERMACCYCIHHFMQMQHFTPNLAVFRNEPLLTGSQTVAAAVPSYRFFRFGGHSHVHAYHPPRMEFGRSSPVDDCQMMRIPAWVLVSNLIYAKRNPRDAQRDKSKC